MINFTDLVPNGYYITNGRVFQMDQRMLHVYGMMEEPYILERVDGIPLATEIFIKMGFIHHQDPERLCHHYLMGSIDIKEMRRGFFPTREGKALTNRKLFYVHELQNWYYSATGKTLSF